MKKFTTVQEFLDDLDADKRAQIEALRRVIMAAEPRLKEHIKWNAPSYILDDEDRITFNVMNKQGVVKLVLHMGATRKEDTKATPVMQDANGIIEWSSNIRGMITFADASELESKLPAVKQIITQWLSIPA